MASGEKFNEGVQVDSIQKRNNGCYIDTSNQSNQMEKYNASNQDFSKLVEGLDGFGKTEYKFFKENPNGPVLVIFREDHKAINVKKENFEVFLQFKNYFNFLATEGTNKEVVGYNEITQLQGDVKKSVDFILGGLASFSSVAIEEYYGNEINTCGVDLSGNEIKKLSALKVIPNIAKEKGLSFEDALDYWYKNGDKYVIEKRNKLWLQNIKNILITGNNTDGKNFIPIIAGGAHAQDLSEQAKDFGFKGVIIFTPKSYK